MQPNATIYNLPLRGAVSRAIPALLVLSIGLAAGAGAAAAQEPPPAPDRWKTAAEFTLTDAGGNRDLTVLTTGLSLRHLRTELFAFELKLEARYGSAGDSTVVKNYKGTFTFDIGPRARWSPFLYSRAEHDPLRHLDVRINSGAGAKYRLYREESRGEAAVSLAMLHSYEALIARETPEPTASARWSLLLNGQRQLHEGVTLSHRTQYQPVFDEPGDYLLTLDTALKVLLSSHVALSISHEFNRDTTPAPDVGADDRLLKAGVIVEL